MRITRRYRILVAVLAALTASGAAGPGVARGGDGELVLSAEERQPIERGLRELTGRIETLRGDKGRMSEGRRDRLADAEVFAKGIAWALKYDATFTTADLKLLKTALERCRGRVAALEAGEAPWAGRKGKVVRGFASAVDGSVQPYAVVVPATYDRARPARLDVVLHGSSRPVGMSELRFLGRFDEGDSPAANAPDRDYIELHPLGRVENGYRWAGEADVFEAIEAACRNYAVDRDRVVLRGMSMGASGAWHLGLKHPDRFVALGPYCGYVDTHEFSKTPQPNFVAVGPLPPHQEKTLHMLDSVDYAANAGMVPAVACMGEKDVFFRAHEIMGRAMANEGLAMVNLISPGTGHVLDPATHAEQMRRIGAIAAKGKDPSPGHVRFVTWTLKYSRCHWLQVLGMDEHYRRAELDARRTVDGMIEVADPKNVTRFAILPPVARADALRVRVGGSAVAVPAVPGDARQRKIVIGKRDGQWAYLGELDDLQLDGKRPGLQGPIDDAFTSPFLCVRGTGPAWNPAVQAWSEARLKRFADEWGRYFRGELPVKDDTAVTPEDVRRCNLILFGDPGSNLWIGRVLPHWPVRWTREECAIGTTNVGAADHAPVLIQPSPLAPGRYVVLNSGHTFHEAELSTLNYLLFPRLGDWALVKVGGKVPEGVSSPLAEEVVRAGFFDEQWGVAGHGAESREPPVRVVRDLGLPREAAVPDRPDSLIGYTEFRTDLPGGRLPNVATMRAAVVRTDGSGRRVLAEELARAPNRWTQFAGWSPDGRQAIVGAGWESPENARWEEEHKQFRYAAEGWLYDMNRVDLATGSATNVTAVERVSFHNSGLFFWPGDPTKLGFQALIDGNSHPFRMDLDGRNKRDLTKDSKEFAYGFSASPDGRRIAYHKSYKVYVADSDGANARAVPTGRPFNFAPQWSGDGRHLLFVAGEHYDCHPYVVAADGTGLRKLADRGGYRGVIEFLDVPDFHGGSSDLPAWSADGTAVYYTARVGPGVELFRVTLGGQSERLTRTPEGSLHYHPTPSPDGRRLAYGSKRDGIRQLYVMDLRDRSERPLTAPSKGRAAMWPHWQPRPNPSRAATTPPGR